MSAFDSIELEQDSLFFSAEKSSIYQLSKVQTLTLQGFKSGYSVEELCRFLNDNKAVCEDKLYELHKQWTENGLLETANSRMANLPYSYYLLPANEPILFKTNISSLYQQITSLYPTNHKNSYKTNLTISAIKIKDPEEKITIVVNGQHKRNCENLNQALISCIFEINELATHEFPRLFVAHAAAVCCNNNVLFMPTYAGQGKSTLTISLTKKNYQIINDDIVPINFDGSITAINSPLKIKSGAWTTLSSIYPEILDKAIITRADKQAMRLWSPSQNYCAPGSKYKVTHLIIPEYKPAGTAQLQSLSHDSVVRYLLKSEPYLPHLVTQSYLKAILQWVKKIAAWHIAYSTTEEAFDLISQIVDSKSYV